MKKTIFAFGVITLFIVSTFASANVLNIKNYNVNLPPVPHSYLSGSTLSKVGYFCKFSTIGSDPNGDKIQYQFDWDSTGFHDYSQYTGLFPSGKSIDFSHPWGNPGLYVVKVRVQDEHGLISDWSNGLEITINYENQRRNIMLTGFWVPTSQMVARFSTNPYVNPEGWQGENWENLGYDIYSFVAKEYYNNQGTWEWSYQQIWNEFWDIVNQVRPIATIGFGQGAKDNTWNIENKAVNWNKWYPDDDGNQPSPNPPDDTVCTGFIRFSTLPIREIEKEINNQTTINAEINFLGTPGFYFCGYLAYLELWYKAQHSDSKNESFCKCAGWIHVNKTISLEECIEATNITIRKTVEKVKKNVNTDEAAPVKFLPRFITINRHKNNLERTSFNAYYKLNLLIFKILGRKEK